MSKMNELSQVLDDMITCGEDMIKAANAIKEIFSSVENAPTVNTTTEEKPPAKDANTPTITKEELRGVLAAKSAAGFKTEVKELLEKYGAQQLKQVRPEDYASILQEAKVIGNV